MAHAAPTSREVARYGGPPDVFGARTHATARWAVPLALALVYGYWAAANTRYGGPITGWNVLFGFVTAIVFFVLYLGVQAVGPHVRREVHAFLWAALWGSATGFLFSLSGRGHTVLASTVLALAVAAPVFMAVFYRYYTHEDAAGHRIR
ncbi:hypothetical protein ABZX30_06980 [Streptomyces sp. NPDC004542]|uniref:hypothetical protein n=1 Tax=Streptomyces sp. NPDC004542 TaxID=3154281 RepID=UPI0033AC719D